MKDTAAALIERALSRGAAVAECYIKTGGTRGVALDSSGGIRSSRTAEGGAALRLFLPNGSRGFASLCGLPDRDDQAAAIVEGALDAARQAGPTSAAGLPGLPSDKGGDGRGLGLFDPRVDTATTSDLEGMLETAVHEASHSDPRIRRVDSASLAASSSEVFLANSAGMQGGYRQTLIHISLSLVAGHSAATAPIRWSRTARTLATFSTALFGDETARMAATTLEGRPPATCTVPALFAPAAAVEVVRHLAQSLRPPGPAPGFTIGSKLLSIIDDGRLPGGIVSAPFDGEGVPSRRTVVVDHGRFAAMTHDCDSAAASGATSTGNSRRVSFRESPRRMPSNFFLPPGSDDPADLMAEAARPGNGIWIQWLRPSAAVPVDRRVFTAVGAGRLLEGGRPGAPIAGLMVHCPLRDLLEGLIGLGNDLTFGFPAGPYGAPSLLFRSVPVGQA